MTDDKEGVQGVRGVAGVQGAAVEQWSNAAVDLSPFTFHLSLITSPRGT